MNDKAQAKAAEKFYTSFLSYTELLFNSYRVKDTLDCDSIIKKITSLSPFVVKEHHYLMHAKQVITSAANENYHVAHSVRSTIIAMIIGTALKLPRHQIIELGVASLVRDINILSLPPETHIDEQVLTEAQRREYFVHPLHAYKALKGMGFPMSVCEAVLQHHERENGSGYPQQLSADNISMNGKIIAVACAYETFCTDAISEEKCGHTGMITLLKNEGKQFNDAVIRALVSSISVYPIGMYVLLSDGKKGQVVDADPENPRFPFVKVLDEESPDGKEVIKRTSPNLVSIARPLTRKEINR